ncbi:MAG TPA: hypothetical protein DHU59_13505 [Clostridiales bacterium]|nr:hypothetical protein [Clostridiales bacterium]
MRQISKNMFLFTVGGLLYYLIEVVWRGYSHISMFALGGICFVLIGLINEYLSWETPLWKQMLIAAVIVTGMELIAGLILNVWLQLNIWDYSNLPFNLWGQISLQYSVIWFLLSLPAIILDDLLRWQLFGEEKPHYKFT